MDSKPSTTINRPLEFGAQLQGVMSGIQSLLEMAGENNHGTVSDSELGNSDDQRMSCAFQATAHHQRPTEFLQVLLDMVQVNFDPNILGTFFLNSNMSFLFDAIPDTPFQLGYLSAVSEENEGFPSFWDGTILPRTGVYGYDLDKADGVFVVVSTGTDRHGLKLVNETLTTLDSGFSVDDAIDLLAGRDPDEKRPVHCGFCLDSALVDRIRISLWVFSTTP